MKVRIHPKTSVSSVATRYCSLKSLFPNGAEIGPKLERAHIALIREGTGKTTYPRNNATGKEDNIDR